MYRHMKKNKKGNSLTHAKPLHFLLLHPFQSLSVTLISYLCSILFHCISLSLLGLTSLSHHHNRPHRHNHHLCHRPTVRGLSLFLGSLFLSFLSPSRTLSVSSLGSLPLTISDLSPPVSLPPAVELRLWPSNSPIASFC